MPWPKLNHFGGHAIKAANIAAIGHADPQAVMSASEGVDEHRENCSLALEKVWVIAPWSARVCFVSTLIAGRARWMNPIGTAVAPILAFPNRHFLLDGVDQPAAGGKGFVTMGRADCDGDADFT